MLHCNQNIYLVLTFAMFFHNKNSNKPNYNIVFLFNHFNHLAVICIFLLYFFSFSHFHTQGCLLTNCARLKQLLHRTPSTWQRLVAEKLTGIFIDLFSGNKRQKANTIFPTGTDCYVERRYYLITSSYGQQMLTLLLETWL